MSVLPCPRWMGVKGPSLSYQSCKPVENSIIVLVVDVGGSHVMILATGHDEPRKCSSGPEMTVEPMISGAKELAEGWTYEVVSIGYPGSARGDRAVSESPNLARDGSGLTFNPPSAARSN